jgi:putative peptide zinc metalloprotease protein
MGRVLMQTTATLGNLGASAAESPPLPALREELQLYPAAANMDGSPAWTIQDPVTNTFYRIGWLEFEILKRWHMGNAEKLLRSLNRETLLDATLGDLNHLQEFLLSCNLLDIHSEKYTSSLLERYRNAHSSKGKWILQHYLFFRIPLWHPDQLLQRVLPHLQWLYTRTTAVVVILLTLLGLLLTARQWDSFSNHLVNSFELSYIIGYLLAIAVAKSLHELGHALTATRHGVRVAHMGVAFLVLWPILYTDTGESWRLKNRHQRLAIASAGIITELALAGMATLAWNLVNEGPLKEALFFLATTSWVISLSINVSPFMRFDGYFILSDILDLPNLHERSFALAKTWLRNLLWGWQDDWPEEFSPRMRRWLILFAFATWIYRLILFIGIALLVYYFFFKLLGIFLLVVELAWFVARPIKNELKVWHQRRSETGFVRKLMILILLAAIISAGLIPYNRQVDAEAWLHASENHTFYTPMSARLTKLPPGPGEFETDQIVYTLAQPELEYKAAQARLAVETLERKLAEIRGLVTGEEMRLQLKQQKATEEARLQSAESEIERLILRAPFNGMLTDIDPMLETGVWINGQQPLGILIGHGPWQAEAFINQTDLKRVATDAPALIYPADNKLKPIKGRVIDIDRTPLEKLPHQLLSVQHGGNINVLASRGDASDLEPQNSLYRVIIELENPTESLRESSAKAVIEGTETRFLDEVFNTIFLVLIREANF